MVPFTPHPLAPPPHRPSLFQTLHLLRRIEARLRRAGLREAVAPAEGVQRTVPLPVGSLGTKEEGLHIEELPGLEEAAVADVVADAVEGRDRIEGRFELCQVPVVSDHGQPPRP